MRVAIQAVGLSPSDKGPAGGLQRRCARIADKPPEAVAVADDSVVLDGCLQKGKAGVDHAANGYSYHVNQPKE
jgi:hypothetical protein